MSTPRHTTARHTTALAAGLVFVALLLVSPAALAASPPTVEAQPSLTETITSAITPSTATITSTLDPRGLPTRWELDLGPTPAQLLPRAAANTTNPESEQITMPLENLQPETTYYYRITAENPDGQAETSLLTFTTAPAPQTNTGPAPIGPGIPLLAIPPNAFPTETPSAPTHPVTTKRKLQKALKACRRKHNKHQRTQCERRARKR